MIKADRSQRSRPIRPELPLCMLRIRPEDQGRQDRVHKPAPDGDARDIVLGPVVLRDEDDITDDVDDSEQHIQSDKGNDSCSRLFWDI